MSHDVIDDRYGRLYELPCQLSKLGHDVAGICLSYQNTATGIFAHADSAATQLEWHSFNAGPGLICGFPQYFRQTAALIRQQQPDVLIGASDAIHAIITWQLSIRTGVPYVIDLYDNFESFGLSRIPGIIPLFRKALQQANGITAVSDSLSQHVSQIAPDTPVITIESTVDPNLFKPIHQGLARQQLGLPARGLFIGTAGSLSGSRGTDLLYQAFKKLVQELPDLHLVLAGDIDPKTPLPKHENIQHLGRLSHDQIPYFFSALDVAVICMKDTEFGRFAFPQKAYEILSTKTPLIAAEVGALQDLFAASPECLYQPESAEHLGKQIHNQLNLPYLPEISIPDWKNQAERMEIFVDSCLFS